MCSSELKFKDDVQMKAQNKHVTHLCPFLSELP